jgi:hypothetical protein
MRDDGWRDLEALTRSVGTSRESFPEGKAAVLARRVAPSSEMKYSDEDRPEPEGERQTLL